MSVSKRLILILFTLLALSMAGSAWGCPVCYGDSDAPIMKGAEMSILFMAVTTYGLIGGGVGMFIVLRRRARSPQKSSESV